MSEARCVHCCELVGELHGSGCLYGGPPLEADRRRTGVTGLVTEADCKGEGVVHMNASLGLLAQRRSAVKRRVVITLEVVTNLDDCTLERRVENFLDPERLASELLGGEKIRMRGTTIEVEA